jgi:hypothetical protein
VDREQLAARSTSLCRERFIHPAILFTQDSLDLTTVHIFEVAVGPSGDSLGDSQCIFIASLDIHIEKASEDFMQGVKRRPHLFATRQLLE